MNFMRLLGIGLVLSGGWEVLADANGALELPEITISRCAAPPVVDGVLGDSCWQTAATITNFHALAKSYDAAAKSNRNRAIRVMITYDSSWLFIGYQVPHPMPKEIKPTVFNHNGPVTADDSLELFVDPGANGKLYFHYMLNAANVGAEKVVAGQSAPKMNDGISWRSGARVTADGWEAEVALPLSFLAGYGDLSRLRMNLNLNLVLPTIDPQRVRIGEEKEWSSWAPVQSSFHEPERFGWVKGLETAQIKAPFFPQWRNIHAGRYELTNGQYTYAITGELANAFAQTGQINVAVTDRPIIGQPKTVEQIVTVNSARKQPLSVRVPVEMPAERIATVNVKNASDGEALQAINLDAADMVALELMRAYVERSYYTTEKEARAVCELSPPAEELSAMSLEARAASGQLIGHETNLSPQTRLAMNLEKLTEGRHEVKLTLCRKDGAALTERNVQVIKRAPKPRCEWKIDRVNHRLLRDGRPFFPFGMHLSCQTLASIDSACKDVAQLGVNAVQIWPLTGADPATARQFLDVAASNNLLATIYIESFMGMELDKIPSIKQAVTDGRLGRMPGGGLCGLKCAIYQLPIVREEKNKLFWDAYAFVRENLLTAVDNIKDCPNLIGYLTFDEPQVYFDQFLAGRDLYRNTNERDGYHPTFLVYSSYIPAGDQWIDWCDVLGTDPYWITAGSKDRGAVNFVADITRMTRQRADGAHKTTYIVPMAERWSATTKRLILPQEQRCQTYLAIINGAQGIIYYNYPLIHQASYDVLKELAAEIKVLGPLICQPEVTQHIVYSSGSDDLGNMNPDVQAALLADPQGGHVLLAANSQCYPVDTTFQFPGLNAPGTVKVTRLFTTNEFEMVEGALKDRVEPFGTRAYVIHEGGGTNPVTINVAMEKHPELAKKETPEIPRSGRPDKKNILPNPGFEKAALPGLPDYMPFINNAGTRIGTPQAQVEQVAEQPFEGKYCLKMICRPNQAARPSAAFCMAPRVDQPTEYVFSVYMRADKDNVRAGFGSLDGLWKHKSVSLTTNWQRYAVSGIIPPVLYKYQMFTIGVESEGTVWFDAMQFEKGVEPTDYEP